MANNQIYSQGFFDEIKSFIDSIEFNKRLSKSNFETLIMTYNLIHAIQNRFH